MKLPNPLKTMANALFPQKVTPKLDFRVGSVVALDSRYYQDRMVRIDEIIGDSFAKVSEFPSGAKILGNPTLSKEAFRPLNQQEISSLTPEQFEALFEMRPDQETSDATEQKEPQENNATQDKSPDTLKPVKDYPVHSLLILNTAKDDNESWQIVPPDEKGLIKIGIVLTSREGLITVRFKEHPDEQFEITHQAMIVRERQNTDPEFHTKHEVNNRTRRNPIDNSTPDPS